MYLQCTYVRSNFLHIFFRRKNSVIFSEFPEIFIADSGHSTLPGEDRYSPELEADAAEAIHVLESVVVEAEAKETDEKFRDLTEVRGEAKRDGPVWQNATPGVKKIQKGEKMAASGECCRVGDGRRVSVTRNV
jgi:hypothetical protein